jgi:hypothetical protein
MEEKDIDKLKEHIKSELAKTELEEEEQWNFIYNFILWDVEWLHLYF